MLFDIFYMLFGFLPPWFSAFVIVAFFVSIIVLLIRLIVYIVEIIPGF